VPESVDSPSTNARAESVSDIRAFLIAEVRDYTRFSQERGDEEATRLVGRFARLTRQAVEPRGGRVIELRGDEALAVFGSARQALRAIRHLSSLCRRGRRYRQL
jgi:class 3 adenylate cyclase